MPEKEDSQTWLAAEPWQDLNFVEEKLCTPAGLGDHLTVIKSTVTKWTGHGGASGDMFLLTVETRVREKRESSETTTHDLVLKATRPEGLQGSKQVGLAREGVFLDRMTRVSDTRDPLFPLKVLLPKCLWAKGDMDLGGKALVMEKIDGVQSGYFFGKHSPHNWDVDVEAETKDIGGVSELDVCCLAAELGAILHARHIGDRSLLEDAENQECLRASKWFGGQGRESWEGTMGYAKSVWKDQWRPTIDEKGVQRFEGKEDTIEWPLSLVNLMDQSFEKVTWEAFQQSALVSEGRFTLVHGDFHPGNMIVTRKEKGLALVDWEVVGVGSGPQDLGQYMVSHSHPSVRRQNQKAILDAYCKVFQTNLSEESFEQHFKKDEKLLREWVNREYAEGGVGRWIWLLPLCGLAFSPKKQQYFVNQVAALLDDFPEIFDKVPLPRA
uniref:Aminoglycoside phosphotransferase domain-containing protein n=1 Tax=Chromera velia CCMP2878 TaxID=1169474 RepID=A0A0G4IAM3_9ALVE|eukprot:Cvel_2106.t1-p1 / transcript=Cvel_2106.t1 / gene=Cvel_2106 / organism=Chromera_velia_CCMP2878 / gene_product=hypothetical protein / transcript_product=hypothetical protein / location=Cvel_scaffold81:71786-73099(+) / protein_length=438 / sequence_SO=supercontig / SO=protein_coding / is_pseudo=false